MEKDLDIQKKTLAPDSRHIFVSKKSEKIISALFLVTDNFRNFAPELSSEIRETSLNILKKSALSHNSYRFDSTNINDVIKTFIYLMSLFGILCPLCFNS